MTRALRVGGRRSRPVVAARRAAASWGVAVLWALSGAVACDGTGTGKLEPEPRPPAAAPTLESPATPAAPETVTADPASEPRLGLWVLAEGARRVLDHPDRIPELIRDARALGATDLFVQVYRAGRSWYPSDIADPTPWRHVHGATGVDPLSALLEQAAAAGFRVHAWVNVLSLSKNEHAPIVQRLGEGAVLVDRHGRSLLDYPDFDVPQPDRRYYRMGTPGVYLDAAAPGVDETLVATFAELIARYPALDGLHLDYIRYPDVLPFAPGTRFGVGLDFGYGADTRARFERETGKRAPFGDSLANANAWDAWRRERVTTLVRDIAAAARAEKPGLAMSAAVWTYADRAYFTMGQDWRAWLEAGSLDFAIPMSYTVDDRVLRYQAEHFAGRPDGDRIWVGLGSWLFAQNPSRAVRQVEIVREAGAKHLAFFSYDSIVTEPGLLEALTIDASEVEVEGAGAVAP